MLNINFVPDDYIQNSESRRTNLLYLVLLLIVMVGIGGSFISIKIRQRALDTEEELVNAKIVKAQQAINQFEELQEKRKVMMKTALVTVELLEPVPRSVLLASLTNNLPRGTSLLQLKLIQKQPSNKPARSIPAADSGGKYQQAQAEMATSATASMSPEKVLETHIDIEGIATSDRQVAAYIEQLNSSILLSNVTLVESKEHEIKKNSAGDIKLRRFKLTAMLKKEVHLSNEDIKAIRERGIENAFY
jgi:Tfp pilus assembly protein PilN